jgi:hypothetical protein
MKKLKPIIGILIFLALLVSCNSDASEGIFYQISQSTTPADIMYTRLLGFNTAETTLYFQTTEGVFKVASGSTTSTELVASVSGSLIKNSAYNATEDKIYILTNDDNSFYKYSTDGSLDEEVVVDDSSYNSSNLDSYTINNMYSNYMLVLEGDDLSGDAGYDIVSYDGTAFSLVAEFTSAEISGYSLDNFIMQTTKHADGTEPIIISFADDSDDDDPAYLHYFVDPTAGGIKLISDITDERIANFYYDDSDEVLYVLDYDGELFLYADVVNSNDDDISDQVSLEDSSLDYDANAFLYPVVYGDELYLISKYSTKSSSLYVYTIDTSDSDASNYTCSDTTSISKGYATSLDSSYIVSSLETPTSTALVPNLFVATRQNGMYEITIAVDYADSNSTSNGDSSDSEEYSF